MIRQSRVLIALVKSALFARYLIYIPALSFAEMLSFRGVLAILIFMLFFGLLVDRERSEKVER